MSTTVLIIAGLLGVVALGWAWLALVARWYRLPEPEAVTVRCADGWQLTLWRTRPRTRRYDEPLVLCHGLGNNHRIFTFQLARVLADAGFESYAIDLRGIGASARRPDGRADHVSLDDYITLDAPAALAGALEHSGARAAFWVGHSMGGMVGLAAATGTFMSQLKGVVTFGTPVFFPLRAVTRLALRLGVWASFPFRLHADVLAQAFAPFVGWVPLPGGSGMANQRNLEGRVARVALATTIAPMWHRVLRQFSQLARHDHFKSLDAERDYREHIRALKVPQLIVGGTADLLAPAAVCRQMLELSGSPDKELVLFGRARGDALDYGHGDLLLGARVTLEVFPVLIKWLQTRATPVDSLQAPHGLHAVDDVAAGHPAAPVRAD